MVTRFDDQSLWRGAKLVIPTEIVNAGYGGTQAGNNLVYNVAAGHYFYISNYFARVGFGSSSVYSYVGIFDTSNNLVYMILDNYGTTNSVTVTNMACPLPLQVDPGYSVFAVSVGGQFVECYVQGWLE